MNAILEFADFRRERKIVEENFVTASDLKPEPCVALVTGGAVLGFDDRVHIDLDRAHTVLSLDEDTTPLRKFQAEVTSASKPYDFAYTFIGPHYGDVVNNTYRGGTSQHPLDNIVCGEWVIKFVYEAIRKSPLLNDSLLIVTWDEHGGFYEHVPPGPTAAPADNSVTSPLNKYGFTFT